MRLFFTTSGKKPGLKQSFVSLNPVRSDRLYEYCFAWETYVSRADVPNDSGIVAVVDGGEET